MARILVVDEDPQIRMFLGINLGTCGHRVVEADSLAEALRLGQGRKFDIIITELGLGYRLKTSGIPLATGSESQ